MKSTDHSSQQQIQDIEELIKEGVDILVISPNDSDALRDVVEKAYDMGIPVVLYDRDVKTDKYTAFVGGDNYDIGKTAAEYLHEKLNGKGKVALLRGMYGATADDERAAGFKDRLIELNSGLNIVEEVFIDYHENDTQINDALKNIVRNNNIPDAIFAMSDIMAMSAADGFKKLFSQYDLPVIIGVDALPTKGGGGILSAIRSGNVAASLVYPIGSIKLIEVVSKILTGNDFDRINLIETALITKDNSQMYEMQFESLLEREAITNNLNRRNAEMAEASAKQQKALFTVLIFSLLLISTLSVMVNLFLKNKTLIKNLRGKNEEIERHLDLLEEQKKHLLTMSKQLEDNMQAKLVFFTNISHDFKTPLSLITGPVEDLIQRTDLPRNVKPTLDILKRNTNKLSRLIDELLDFRSIENGKIRVNPVKGRLDLFLSELAKMFKKAISDKNIQFTYIVDTADYEILFDPSLAEKIFINILSNALKHVNPYGKIKVHLGLDDSATGKSTVLRVFNTGSYISPEQAKDIFQCFYTLDTNQKGTGIGMALVSSIVDSLNGKITVDSDPSSGTEFTVTLPVMESAGNTSDFSFAGYDADFAKQKLATLGNDLVDIGIVDEMNGDGRDVVLVIDDNNDIRQYIRTSLSSDYRVITAKNGEDGIAKAEQMMPDIILCDILMPDKDGYEVCSILKSREATKHIPVIMVTCCALDEHRAKGYEAGADSFLEKPFNITTLKIRIRKLLEKENNVKSQLRGDWLIGKDISKLSSAQRDLLNTIKKYVENHLDENITVEDISASIGYSKSKLYRELKEVTDFTLIELVTLVRLRKAIDFMALENMNVSQASISTGYSSPSYFARTFIKYYHVSPTEYMKQH